MSIYNHDKKVDVEIPLLLAGPIIRRVEKSKVCIWISTSKKVQAKVRIFRIYRLEEGGMVNSSENVPSNSKVPLLEYRPNLQLVGEGINTPLQLGDNLFINLINAKPLNQSKNKEVLKNDNMCQEFPTNELLAYDLELILNSEKTGIKETITLEDLGLLSGANSIIYPHYDDMSLSSRNNDKSKNNIGYPALPMFFIPEGKYASLNLLYGSCRKLHGDDEDSLIIGDKIMKDFFFDLKKRPSVLFLIGDQIYADDVSGPLITFLKKFSSNLMGWHESINGIEKKLDELDIGERGEIVRKYANFSTDAGDNHLLGFGEFAAMYLLAWNQENWPTQFEQLQMKSSLSSSSFKKKYLNELKELEQSRLTLTGVRRLLANVPTYMICDDHEITDDWNINKRWCNEVEQSSCGKQIISNGLVAYWAFQAWGNDPDSFDNNFTEKIINYLNLKKLLGSSLAESQTSSTTTPSSESSFSQKSENVVLSEIHDLENRILLNKNWTFMAPTYPLSVFLDCRTQRTFVDDEGPPYLLSEDALEYMKLNLIKSGYKKGDPLILISPTPVFGFELAESVQRFLTSISGSYKWDLETWRANEKGFAKFLTFLTGNFDPAYCVFLSGDVHYAFTMKAHFDHLKQTPKMGSFTEWNTNLKEKSVTPIAQLTSSPFRSNSLTNRMVAILILNLVHKLVVFKKYLLRKKLVNKSPDDVTLNYDYLKRLPDVCNQSDNTGNSSYHGDKRKIYFSKHPDDKSIFEKIRVIAFNLKVKFFRKDSVEMSRVNSPWTERRLLIKPRGQTSLPVLAKNNMGYVRLDLDSKSIEHMLYFLDKGIMRNSQAKIHFKQ